MRQKKIGIDNFSGLPNEQNEEAPEEEGEIGFKMPLHLPHAFARSKEQFFLFLSDPSKKYIIIGGFS